MRKAFVSTLAALAALAFALPAFAADACCPAGGAAKPEAQVAAAADPHAGMDMGGNAGPERIHEGKKGGYSLAFELFPMKGEGFTHHLMVSVRDAAGKVVVGAKVGFDVVAPAAAKRKDQKVMAMGMSDGYGANLDLGAKGKYTIKVKVVGGGADLLYDFPYEVK